MIHVCYAIHDANGRYSKYMGTAICSVLANTRKPVTIHLIHDATLTKDNQQKFRNLAAKFKQKIKFYEIDLESLMDLNNKYSGVSIGTLFRLRMDNILPPEIEKVIYLDADTVCHLDVSELWSVPLKENLAAACLDTYIKDNADKVYSCFSGLIPKDTYFNAGVMVLNLKMIRAELNLGASCLQFLQDYPKCIFLDQDALNYVLLGRVFFLDAKYNVFTKPLRAMNDSKLGPAIYHFAGESVTYEEPIEVDMLFLSYLKQTPWRPALETIYEDIIHRRKLQMEITQKFMAVFRREKHKLIYICLDKAIVSFLKFVPLDRARDYCIDDDDKYWNMKNTILNIYPFAHLHGETTGEFLMIVMANSPEHYAELKELLLGLGLTENVDFFDGKMMLLLSQDGYKVNY